MATSGDCNLAIDTRASVTPSYWIRAHRRRANTMMERRDRVAEMTPAQALFSLRGGRIRWRHRSGTSEKFAPAAYDSELQEGWARVEPPSWFQPIGASRSALLTPPSPLQERDSESPSSPLLIGVTSRSFDQRTSRRLNSCPDLATNAGTGTLPTDCAPALQGFELGPQGRSVPGEGIRPLSGENVVISTTGG